MGIERSRCIDNADGIWPKLKNFLLSDHRLARFRVGARKRLLVATQDYASLPQVEIELGIVIDPNRFNKSRRKLRLYIVLTAARMTE